MDAPRIFKRQRNRLKIPRQRLGKIFEQSEEPHADEADRAYYIQSQGTTKSHQPPDLAIEIVVSHSEKKALRAGEFLKIPEIWVLDLRRHRLTFHHLASKDNLEGAYRPQPRSRAFPLLTSTEVLERLDDPEPDAAAFHQNCRDWARGVLVPRREAGK